MKREFISVIVPVYNVEYYLKQCLDSIVNQTYRNLEIILVDDGSTDSSGDICDEYAHKDARIKVIHKENGGLSSARNAGLDVCTSGGELIAFVDSDDWLELDMFEVLYTNLKEKNVDMVYCNCRQIDEDGVVIQDNYFKYKNVPLIKGKSKLAISRCVGIGCSQIITKSVRDKMIPFKKTVIAHDWLAAFIANEGKGMCYIDETLFDYRLHNTNVFGGRSFSQNVSRWKKEHGSDYNSFLRYREDSINKAYLGGVIMCKDYVNNAKDQKFIEKNINYYETILKHKCIYYMNTYFEILAGKNQFKKMIKEIVLFHFPIIAYIAFKRVKVN